MSDFKQMIDNVRDNANQPTTSGLTTDAKIGARINTAQTLIYNLITKKDRAYFEETDDTLDLVADQQEYDLPACLLDRRIRLIERYYTDRWYPMYKVDYSEKDSYIGSPSSLLYAISGYGYYGGYYIRNNKIGICPIPDKSESNVIRFTYVRLLAPMHYGTVAGVTSTTLTFAATPTVGNLLVYPPSTYIGELVRIISGTGAGQQRKITAYNSTTRVATVDSAWSTNPDTNSVYSLVSSIKEDYHPAIEWLATVLLEMKGGDRSRITYANDMYKHCLDIILDELEERVIDEPRYFRYTSEFEDF